MAKRELKHKWPALDKSGALLVDKPSGWTSHDVVNFFRLRFNIPKIGHCGTLDPAATGLLVLVMGKATRLSQGLSGQDKTYEGTMLLGTVTDSLDLDGAVLEQNDWSDVTPEMIVAASRDFIGEIDQTPPMVSAKKRDGKRLYDLARRGVVVDMEPVKVTIHKFDFIAFDLPRADFVLKCSKGTYARALCGDMGAKLGCGAALQSLRRTQSGLFNIADAVTVDAVREWDQETLAARINLDFLPSLL